MEIAHGNLLHADVQALVNTVNTEGVMGKGIALQFKRAYPEAYDVYREACKAGAVTLGKMHIVDLGGLAGGPRYIINFPTKAHWKSKSKLTDIQKGLEDLVIQVQTHSIKSLAIPPLGCGHGGLEWSQVRPLIFAAFEQIPAVKAVVYPPDGAPAAAEMPNKTERPKMSIGRAALIALMSKYKGAQLAPIIRLLEVHKLMYFLQESGEPLRLDYSAQQYGPYASNLRHVLSKVEGHWLTGYGDGQDSPQKELDLLEGADVEAFDFLSERFDTLDRMERVAHLIEGYEDPYGLELLATVHWVLCHDESANDSADMAVKAVHAWNTRKASTMKPEHIASAWNRLREHRWDTESRSALKRSRASSL
ncbi:macro domain-containing protein [Pseudoxanthomonas sp. CF125]|uniref:type II toxin-antitoxin system antitoxin DNA ADP-ribosyl glycohydrolase DarG n=1 Tax=Pseudoxanthomonas sp. CF125 TaxID=1855303 RepID=UPI000886439B|nr:macro domain-containing protein [Pseudoxanthomonas sp. CF125]SDQ75692.1 O-acetyl-ADP-ribose deacetylase (regulator of RNase III), contains Macro domain [Pseudoxanthomonas sp. CF125]